MSISSVINRTQADLKTDEDQFYDLSTLKKSFDSFIHHEVDPVSRRFPERQWNNFNQPGYKWISSAPLSTELVSENGWENVYVTEDGIHVSKKTGVDSKHPNVTAYRATLKPVTGVTVDQMYRAIWNKENNVGVIPHLKVVEVIAEEPGTKVCYQVFGDFGWGVSDRHNVMTMTLEQKSATVLRISWEESPIESITESSFNGKLSTAAVECPVNRGYWELDLEKQEFTQVILTNPGGAIPTWASNKATNDAMPKNLRTFLEYAKTL